MFVDRYMTQKLFAFAKGKCCAESCDNPMFQEVLLAGHLYQNVLRVSLSLAVYSDVSLSLYLSAYFELCVMVTCHVLNLCGSSVMM